MRAWVSVTCLSAVLAHAEVQWCRAAAAGMPLALLLACPLDTNGILHLDVAFSQSPPFPLSPPFWRERRLQVRHTR